MAGKNPTVGTSKAAAICKGPVEPAMKSCAHASERVKSTNPSFLAYKAANTPCSASKLCNCAAFSSSPGPAVSTTCLCSSITPVTNSQYCSRERLFAEPPLPACTKSHALSGPMSNCSASLLRCAANCSAGKVRYGALGSIIGWPISRKKARTKSRLYSYSGLADCERFCLMRC
ncbi:Uncharacterised protein [Vibrio cholerae]|nr:Uncharacterised protein [Vibrio cholerae]